ncbi:hypothetical protein D8780_12750 [Notoacmeibacter ruber]|uniref:Biopolymer transporter Tol n=1 Tax=Notoacmeibacter ruber TaxID=2670375 RepID=A0A3L7JE69_9HYPH|nr:hypothetical protein D8780_12750 [Notoacmeibacter ruber]
MSARYPETPDGRYFVAKGRLWRKSDPSLSDNERQDTVDDLMAARREVRDAPDDESRKAARRRVDAAKKRLGERGPVWWTDGAPDETRKAPWNTRYADWWAGLGDEEKARGNPD